MARANSQTLDATGAVVFQDTNGCSQFTVHCQSGSTQVALVQVDGLHAVTDWFRIEKGGTQTFEMSHFAIKKVTIKGNGGNTTVNWGITGIKEPSN